VSVGAPAFDERRPGRWNALREQAERLAAPLPPLLVEAERVAATVTLGVHGRRRVGSGEAFWQFRRYRAEDASTAIDWRQSAKSQHLFVRENEWEAAESVWLWRDASASMDYKSRFANVSKSERATVLSLAVLSLLMRAGERIALMGEPWPPASGRVALRRLAYRLTETMTGGASLPEPGRMPRYAKAVLVSDFLGPLDQWTALIADLGGRGVTGHLLQVLDPAEEDLPFDGRTRFEGVEEPAAITFGRAETLRGDYARRLAAHRDTLRDTCRRFGWSFAAHRTDHAPATALLALYGALAAHKPARAHA
jgi:uncharacterized protein (DUF58 family)